MILHLPDGGQRRELHSSLGQSLPTPLAAVKQREELRHHEPLGPGLLNGLTKSPGCDHVFNEEQRAPLFKLRPSINWDVPCFFGSLG